MFLHNATHLWQKRRLQAAAPTHAQRSGGLDLAQKCLHMRRNRLGSNPRAAERRLGAAECRQEHIHRMQNNSSHPYTNWTFAQVEARFACGSMVHFDLVSQNICTRCKCFVKQDVFFRPAGGEISCRVNDRVSCVNHRNGRSVDTLAVYSPAFAASLR
jgi:hypothetical protein